MENKPFRNLALAQKAIHEHLEMCSVEAPSSITELYIAVKDNPNILNKHQVDTYVKRLHRNGKLHRIREGLSYKYWLKTETSKPLEKAPVTVAEFIQTAKPVSELQTCTRYRKTFRKSKLLIR